MQVSNWIKNLLLSCASIIFLFVCAEVILRFLPVQDGLQIQAVNTSNPTFHAAANRDVIYSASWDLKFKNRKHVNNAGFLNKHNYTTQDPRKLIAVVGDSYIESLQVKDTETYYELLQQSNDNLRIYSFGFSSAPLSQYLIWAKFAKQNYNNKYLIINVVGNDFDESYEKYSKVPGFYHYAKNRDGMLALKRNDLQPSKLNKILVKSRLIAYLARNVQIQSSLRRIKMRNIKAVANTSAEADLGRLRDSYLAIDAFFRDLPEYSGLSSKNILFVIDDRTTTYGNYNQSDIENSYFYQVKKYFLFMAKQHGYAVLDSAIPFAVHYQQYQQHFEFPYDYHWNTLGHAVIAQAIRNNPWWQQISVN